MGKTLELLNKRYADRLDCEIDDGDIPFGGGYFVDVKTGWWLEGEIDLVCGAYDTLKEVEAALRKSRKATPEELAEWLEAFPE